MSRPEVAGTKKKVSSKKPTERKKKTAAKRTPDPIPTDPLVLGVADMPAVPVLRHALVSWGTGQGHQADQDTALLARELSEKTCHFCGTPSSPTMALGTPWNKVELCKCLELVSLGVSEYTSLMQEFGSQKTATAPPKGFISSSTSPPTGDILNDFQKKYGRVRLREDRYQEFFPKWKERIPEIMELAKKRLLPHSEFIYANQCSCGTDFSVNAGMIVRSMTKHGSHIEMKKCKACRDSLLATKNQGNTNSTEGLESNEKFAKPSKKKKSKSRNGLVSLSPLPTEDPVVASTGDGDASFGDVLGPALAALQESA